MEAKINNAKFAFYYMLSLVALIFTALPAGMIVFQIINREVPDILGLFQGRFSPEQLKFAISALVIAAPIYFLVMRKIMSSLKSGELETGAGVRRWLTYFILFVSAVVMIGWLIATINSFLDGELTAKFVLKAMTAILIAAAIFSFYLFDLRRPDAAAGARVIRIYAYAGLAAVIAVFAASLFYVESPAETRNRKIDNLILEHFNSIDSAVATFYRENGRMPDDLDAVKNDYTFITDENLNDPVSGERFEYRVTGEREYELCADFRTSNLSDETEYYYYRDRWPHEAGRQCLKQRVIIEDKNMILPRPAVD